MDDQQGSLSDNTEFHINKVFEAITVDLKNKTGSFVQFGLSNQQNQSCGWTDYPPCHVQYIHDLSTQSNISTISSITEIPSPLYTKVLKNTDYPVQCICIPYQNTSHLEINANNDLICLIDIGGGNFINIVYVNNTQFIAEQCQSSSSSSYKNTSNIDHDYGFSNNQLIQVPLSTGTSLTQKSNRKQLIDNLSQNLVPNISGTYIPLGGSSNVTIVQQLIPEFKRFQKLPKNLLKTQLKTISEVIPLRLSYSDVLSKSILTSSFLTIAALKPIQENSMKKVIGKNLKNKSRTVVLKYQNLSVSEHGSPKFELPKTLVKKVNSNLLRHCISLNDIRSLNRSANVTCDMFNNFEKKEDLKFLKRNDKAETLNNSNIQNNSTKRINRLQRCPIQINNNLYMINSFSKTVCINNKIETIKLQQMKNQQNRKKDSNATTFRDMSKTFYKYYNHWSQIIFKILFWLLYLICNVFIISVNLMVQLRKHCLYNFTVYVKYLWIYMLSKISQIHFLNNFTKWIYVWFGNKFAFWKRLKTENKTDRCTNLIGGLDTNIILPTTGEEAMKRLLACKGKDPYSILGVTPTCSDDDVKKYYKRQAFLVHPDKNNQPGAEEAFKILVHAFDIIGEPEQRQVFDQTRQVEATWGELNDLICQLHKKMEQAANTIHCTNCGLRHKRILTQRPCYAARYCVQCQIRHSVREGDIWAESCFMGFLWYYYACMEGAVYDVTDWAACQAHSLKYLKANIHAIQYRIVLGQRPIFDSINSNNIKKKSTNSNTRYQADLEDFLHNFYNHNNGRSSCTMSSNLMKGDNRRRKTKRKK
ncbi:LOW QUALITY PROTEIN: uncharacterized protein LOC131669569 [Phymastichus coffea]|uniref:LOW QUALITY PROTEIN: uncharacterized protein LOC131669569 n=1 Tax=Phymastichus coffea TaxID=108790 RepID=UPI00273AD9F1|nr:LOW QUALITY PROTEIN: uncharacterized protein LOC131669569 [Phymastichus coffea]